MTRPLTLMHWGAYHPQVENGRLAAMAPHPDDPDPSPLGASVPGAVTDALRIRGPAVRAGFLDRGAASRAGRGAEPFVAVDWDTATRLVARELDRIRGTHGNAAIFGGSYGWASAGRFHHAQGQLHRFLNLAGGYVRSVNTHSHAAAEVLLPHVIGSRDGLEARQTPWSLIAGHTGLFVAFGGLPARNGQVSAGGVARHEVAAALAVARRSGTRLVNVSPLRSDIDAALGAEWLPVVPGSDTALMLALCHTLADEGRADEGFLARCCSGWPVLRDYLSGAADGTARSADWAAPLCGLPAATIRDLARRMAANRTMIAVAWSLQRAEHGEQPLWAAIALAAMLGQIGLPGGGFGFGYGAANRVGRPELPFAWPSLPQGRNPVADFIPVARLTDMLEWPGAEFAYDGATHRYPDIRMVWWAGGNPFHHQQDLNRLRVAWRRPEVVVVQEPWWNATARHADIVLPATTPLERDDLGIAKSEGHLVAMRRAIDPVGGARSDHAILAAIARELSLAEAFTEGRDERGWIRHLYDEGRVRAAAHGHALPDFDAFWAAGQFRLPDPPAEPLLAAFRADPAGRPLATPSGRIELASARIAGFGLADCPGHPAWLPPREWAGASAARRFPLHLISAQPATRLHSQYDNGAVARAAKVAGREPVTLHPDDAARRGIAAGDVVRLWNDRGACLAGAVLSADVRPGVVLLATGAWFDPGEDGLERHGNPNALTQDRGTSGLAQGPVAQSCLVEAERWRGAAPSVAVHEPPALRTGA
jgi:biotin/methionine sulfoxide reductase